MHSLAHSDAVLPLQLEAVSRPMLFPAHCPFARALEGLRPLRLLDLCADDFLPAFGPAARSPHVSQSATQLLAAPLRTSHNTIDGLIELDA